MVKMDGIVEIGYTGAALRTQTGTTVSHSLPFRCEPKFLDPLGLGQGG